LYPGEISNASWAMEKKTKVRGRFREVTTGFRRKRGGTFGRRGKWQR